MNRLDAPPSPRARSGFTLVELLLVVVILGTLAAIVVPQFNVASGETREAALAQDLKSLRKAILLYRVQHNDDYPGPDESSIIAQLTGTTDVSGDTSGSDYGPYIRGPVWPKNHINGMSSLSVVSGALPGTPDGASGWIYSLQNGEIRANVAGDAPSGTPYWDL